MNKSLFLDINSPLDQFDIRNLISIDLPILGNLHLSITNIGLYLFLGTFAAITLNVIANNNNKLVCNGWSLSQETIYATIHGIVVNQINPLKGQR